MTIKGIFFDASGVFYRRPERKKKYVAGLLKAHGFATELAGPERQRLQALRVQATRGEISPEAHWEQLLLMHGVTSAEQRRALLAQIDDYSDRVQPIAGGAQALASLKERGFLLGVITDTTYPIERKMRWLEAVGVAEFIDLVACSTVVGLHKPDVAFYLEAMRQAQLTAGESAFVGHDTEELLGARRAGMATVAVHYDPDAQADYYADSLLGLLDVPIFQVDHC